MHHIGRALRVGTATLVAAVSMSCGIEGPTSVVGRTGSASPSLRPENGLLSDIGALKQMLAADDFHADLDPANAAGIKERRAQLDSVLAGFEARLTDPVQRPGIEQAGEPPPPCYLNGTLDKCFIVAQHTIAMAGNGNVSQVTVVTGDQSAVVSYTVDGTLKTPIAVNNGPLGLSTPTYAMNRAFTFAAVNCTGSNHQLVSKATHVVSTSFIGITSVSGSTTSPGSDSCNNTGLTITLSPSTIGANSISNITVTGATQCVNASVTSSNESVARVQDYGNGNYAAFDAGPGTATITATCGQQRASALLTVKEEVDLESSSIEVGETTSATSNCSSATWSSSNTGVATVSGGSITGIAVGAANIASTGCGSSAMASLSVTAATDPTCDDDAAINYGDPGECQYADPPPSTCDDETADNYGGALPCTYPPDPPSVCNDTEASNYGGPLPCTYDNPGDPTDPGTGGIDPGGGGTGSGDPDDPCTYDPYSDLCTGGGEIYAEAIRVRGTSIARTSSAASATGALEQRRYYMVLLDKWTNNKLEAMVGRFYHHGVYVDAIFLSAQHPSGLGWTLALRAMQQDRVVSTSDRSGAPRTIRLFSDGSVTHSRGGKAGVHSGAQTVSSTTVAAMSNQLSTVVLPALSQHTKHGSKKSTGIQFMEMR